MKVPHLPCKQLDLHVTPMTMLNSKNTVFTNSIFMLNTLTLKTCFFFFSTSWTRLHFLLCQ